MKAFIIGGTGTLGQALTRKLISESYYNEIVIFSRDELKQKLMASQFGHNKQIKYVIGDVRDIEALCRAARGSETIFHLAALKHVDTAQVNPIEAVKTNLLGSINVVDAAEVVGAKYCVLSSTDKAVDPLNVYGMTKGIAEEIFFKANLGGSPTKFSVFRWGNVLNSRGSVLSLWEHTLKTEKKIYVTEEGMTRYWILLEDAVSFLLLNYRSAPHSSPCIPPIKASGILTMAKALADVLGIEGFEIVPTGARVGEKTHERLYSAHSRYSLLDSQTSPQYSVDELKDMIHRSGVTS